MPSISPIAERNWNQRMRSMYQKVARARSTSTSR